MGQPWDWRPSSCWLARELPKAWTIRGVPGASLLSVRLVGCSVRHPRGGLEELTGLARLAGPEAQSWGRPDLNNLSPPRGCHTTHTAGS